MILRDCREAKEPEPEKPPPKRFTTAARAAASRANGAKGKGPTTDAGRAKVKFNAITHGASCKEIIFLPGEDEGAFWAKVDQIIIEEGAQGELEIEAIVTAAYSRVTKRRAINANAIAVIEQMAQIEDHYHEGKLLEVHALIPKIVEAPAVTIHMLMNSTLGCAFLIREFTSLELRLKSHYSFEVSQREYCLRLAGHSPDELFTDPVVRDLNRSYLGSIRGPGGFTIEMAANSLMYDRPAGITETEFTRRMGPFVRDLVSVEQGHAELMKFVRDRIKRLQERMELTGFREERELNAARGAAQSPCDHEADKRDRHVNQSDRNFATAVRLLLALKQERRKFGDRSQAETRPPDRQPPGPGLERPEGTSDPVEMDPREADIPAGEAEVQSEPETTQVVSPVGGNNPASPAPAVIKPAPAADNHDAAVAVVEKDQNGCVHRRDFDPLE